jgi:hypothetical protein
MSLTAEQIQDLPWATLDDLLDAKEDVAAYGRCYAEILDIEGDMRMRRILPGSRATPIHPPPQVGETG